MEYNIYCDESCHLEHDDSTVMVLGGIYCPNSKKAELFEKIRKLKVAHGLDPFFEIKWTKVSYSKIDFYSDLVKLFAEEDCLSYRCLVIKNKAKLNHEKYNRGSHDLWYYKMYYLMLNAIILPENQYNIYIDIKDTLGRKRIDTLQDVLCNNIYDFKKDVVKRITQIDSKESELLQLADLLNGAICFFHRGLHKVKNANQGKVAIVKMLSEQHDLSRKTPIESQKFNLFIWTPKL
ncbi:MAG: DUF3800 domain-containing protein [Mogibacterium sp.]|nr:DUF3800 domain-containing protein [Mogibacterium sp.]